MVLLQKMHNTMVLLLVCKNISCILILLVCDFVVHKLYYVGVKTLLIKHSARLCNKVSLFCW